MQVHGDSRPLSHAATTGEDETPAASFHPHEAMVGAPMYPVPLVSGMPPQQVYVGQPPPPHGSPYMSSQQPPSTITTATVPTTTTIDGLAAQFQALGIPAASSTPHYQLQSGDSETGDDNDGTTETEDDPVKLFVGQVRLQPEYCLCHCLPWNISRFCSV